MEYNKELTNFLVDEAKSKIEIENFEQRQFDLLNSYQFPIVIYKIELNEIGRKFFQVNYLFLFD